MRRWLSLALIVAIAITACAPIDPAEHEWCHIYNLTDPMLNLFIDHGGQERVSGGGIHGEWQPGTSNYLYQFEIIEPFNVYPDALEVYVSRGLSGGYSGAIGINEVEGTAFGHDVSLLNEAGLAPGQTSANFPLEIAFNESSPVGDDRILISFTTYPGEIYVNTIAVYGRGVSPYGYTECGDAAATNTPVDIPTETTIPPTATNTVAPSITNTPTITHTPTATIFSNCSVEYDFTVHDGGFEANNYPGASSSAEHGVWVAGVGWQGTFHNTSAIGNNWVGALSIINRDFPQEIIASSVEWTYTKSPGNQASTTAIREFFYFPTITSEKRSVASNSVSSGTYTITGSWELNVGDDFRYVHGYHQDTSSPYTASGSFNLTSLIIEGVCIEPSPTPTQTFTPTTTNTPAINSPTPNSATATRTQPPTLTRTLTPTNLPPIFSPTPFTPFPTWTPENTLPVPTELPTRTLIPHSTALGTVTAEATFPVPGFGTGAPDITAISTAPSLGTLAAVDGHSDIYNLLSTAVVEVNDLPGDLTGYVPDPDITPMLGYAKWFLSCSSLYEILGQNAGTMACHATVGISLVVILAAVYNGLRIIVLVMKFAVWIFMKIRDLIPLI